MRANWIAPLTGLALGWAALAGTTAHAAVPAAPMPEERAFLHVEPVAKATKAARLGACGGDYVKSKSKRKKKAYCGRKSPALKDS